MTTEQPSEKTRAFAALCNQIEAAGDPGTDGGAIAGLYLAAKLVPPHSDFDRLTVPWFQCGQVGTINQDSDTPGHPRAP